MNKLLSIVAITSLAIALPLYAHAYDPEACDARLVDFIKTFEDDQEKYDELRKTVLAKSNELVQEAYTKSQASAPFPEQRGDPTWANIAVAQMEAGVQFAEAAILRRELIETHEAANLRLIEAAIPMMKACFSD